MKTIRVSSTTKCITLANSIATMLLDNGQMQISAIGAAAVNQAVKGIAIARGMMANYGHDIVCRPSFRNTFLDGIEKTVMDISIEDCDMGCAQ